MKSDDFISRLVDETYTYVSSEEAQAEFSHFEQASSTHRYPAPDNHLFRFLNTQKCIFTHIQHQTKTSCFRLKLRGKYLDIPSNWSFFPKLYKACVAEESKLLEIKDEDFVQALGGLFERPALKMVLFTASGRPYFIACGEENYSFVKAWLYKYLEGETSFEETIKKAA